MQSLQDKASKKGALMTQQLIPQSAEAVDEALGMKQEPSSGHNLHLDFLNRNEDEPRESFGYTSDGTVKVKLACQKGGQVKGCVSSRAEHMAFHAPRNSVSLGLDRELNGSSDIHWWEVVSNLDLLEELKLIDNDEHRTNIAKFRSICEVVTPTTRPEGECTAWRHVARFMQVRVKNCPKCCYLVTEQKYKKHVNKKKDCSMKGIEYYTYLQLGGQYVCPKCIRTFDQLSQLQVHMAKNWTETQFLRLGYKASLFKDFSQRDNKRESLLTSLPPEQQAKRMEKQLKEICDDKSQGLIAFLTEPEATLRMICN